MTTGEPEFNFDEAFSGYELEQIEIYAKNRAIGFAKWVANEDLKMYVEGWCQPGGSNGFHYTTEQLYDLYIKSRI